MKRLIASALVLVELAAFPALAVAVPRLLLPPSTSKATRIAADEFRKYWRETCGSEIAVDEKDDGISPYVKIGQPEADMSFDPTFDTYYVRSVADGGRTNLVLAGGNARSTLYAVYDFLERRCGCRWFWDGDVVPKAAAIDIGGLDVRERSRFEFRATHYFAHRGLTRFQATHWGLDDWKREIDFCLKSRLNFFMLQIGLDDVFQRAFPDVVSYPDPSVTQPPEWKGRPGYDNHSPHWDLAYRGRLRKAIMDYAYDRGLMHPAEFGTLTHWFSRTPQDFLDKLKPPFLPQDSTSYKEPSGLIWDIRQPKWFDMYWRITEAQIESWYKPDLLFTPGFDERLMYRDRERNMLFKTDVVTRYLDSAKKRYPDSRLLIEGWDLYISWEPSEVREFISRLDPKTTVIWDYEADASRKFRSSNPNRPSGVFTEWGVVGRFPYVFGMLMALERGCDIRLDYDTVTMRQRVIRDDPFCVGYMLWPETSHSDTFAWRYFASNCWRLSDASVPEILAAFCRDRYGKDAATFESVWRKVLPVSMLANWNSIYAIDVTTDSGLRGRWNDAAALDRFVFPPCLRRAPEIFRDIARLPRRDAFAARDAIDLARTVGDRLIIASGSELAKRYRHLGENGCKLVDLEKYAAAYVSAGEAMARVLAMHGDYSLAESLDRLSTIHPVPNPDFERVLFENAANSYCRSHQAEFAAHWYVDSMRDITSDLLAAARRGTVEKLPRSKRDREVEMLALPHPIRSQALDLPRTDENYRKAMLDFAAAADVLTAARPSPEEEPAEVPFAALRFGYRYTQPDKWPDMHAALKKNLGAFDEVWFSTGVSFPSLQWHEEHARQCAAAAADLRRLGIVPSIEIQTIIGHTDAILDSGDCTGQNWGTMVSADGLAAKRLSCPRDPNLIAYFTRVAELHAAWKPGSMWVDDDLSYRNRAPLLDSKNNLPGCFCDRCLAGFSKADGRPWERGELVRRIRADKDVRRRWDDYSCAGFAELTRAIAAAVHRLSPETVMGYQYGGLLHPAIPKGLFDGCGLPVRLRPGAGAYWDTDPHLQLGKAYTLQRMLCDVRKEKWVGACCPEIETCPRTFACRTAQGIVLEAFENLALGMDFVSMFVADARTDENTAFYADRLFPRLRAAYPFLKDYRDANVGTTPCGFAVPGNAPAPLVACRGVPITGAGGRSLGNLPDVASIPVRMAGSGDVDKKAPGYQTRVMQIASSTGLSEYYARCDKASGGRLPVVFEYPVMAFALPRVRDDGSLATLAIVNASIDRQEPVRVRLRGVPARVASGVWRALHEKPVTLQIERQGSDAVVTLPALAAWNCGWLRL